MRLLRPLSLLSLTTADDVDDWRTLLKAAKEVEARTAVETAAVQGSRDGRNLLAWFHDEGHDGLKRDPVRAAALYRPSADAGQPHAQWLLGVMLDTGDGDAEDLEAASRCSSAPRRKA